MDTPTTVTDCFVRIHQPRTHPTGSMKAIQANASASYAKICFTPETATTPVTRFERRFVCAERVLWINTPAAIVHRLCVQMMATMKVMTIARSTANRKLSCVKCDGGASSSIPCINSISVLRASLWPLSSAKDLGVSKSELYVVRDAPASASALIASTLPLLAAPCMGVCPAWLRASRDAPACTSALMAFACPSAAATCKGEYPSSSCADRDAPASISAAIDGSSPLYAAVCIAVLPSVPAVSRGAPAAIRALSASVHPNPAASCSGVNVDDVEVPIPVLTCTTSRSKPAAARTSIAFALSYITAM
mmetsp:Transcript_30544/g.77877  ORF Transcript_30544/g.77877 Transcript_30544/m.77877 type:complete len:306 (-) Transcript_30544:313-1230(-)